jgi:hypothetical protein
MNNWLALVLTSAAVGALASSVVTFVGQLLERRARREELLLVKALEVAKARNEVMVRQAERLASGMIVPDMVFSAEVYFRWLECLMKTGKFPPDADAWRPKEEK